MLRKALEMMNVCLFFFPLSLSHLARRNFVPRVGLGFMTVLFVCISFPSIAARPKKEHILPYYSAFRRGLRLFFLLLSRIPYSIFFC